MRGSGRDALPSVSVQEAGHAGRHTLINLDLLIAYLASDAYQNGEAAQPAPEYGKLRRIDE